MQKGKYPPQPTDTRWIVLQYRLTQWDNVAQKDDFNPCIPVTAWVTIISSPNPVELLGGE